MTKVMKLPNTEGKESLFLEDDNPGFLTVLEEHPEIKTLYKRRENYPPVLEINGVNPILHVMIEGIIENQLHDPALKDIREVFEKLQQEQSLTAHAARAAIAQIFIHDFVAMFNDSKPFDLEAYTRRLYLLGTDVSQLGRNDRCPCGSGLKFKRCCSPYADSFAVSPLAGRLDLGYSSYILDEPEDLKDPLAPIFQLEARFHISEYMERFEDLEGAEIVLKENIECARTYQEGSYLKNAWQDYEVFCANNEGYLEEGFEATEQLIKLADDDEEKGNLYCDRADLMAKRENLEDAVREYLNLFDILPNFHFGRYRYALMLSEYERKDEARTVLADLLAIRTLDEDTRFEAEELLKDL